MVVLQPAASVVKIEFDETPSLVSVSPLTSLYGGDDGDENRSMSPDVLGLKRELEHGANGSYDDDGAQTEGDASAGSPNVLGMKLEPAPDELANDSTALGTIVSSLNAVVAAILHANATTAFSEKAAGWRERLNIIEQSAAQTPKFLVAVLGASGAGKSWLINALLGDHIVPTSGVKACTSMPIEVSYHPHELVNAQIEFISRESWLEEINHLISALKDVLGSAVRLVEDGQEAWARIHAVYPELTAEDFLKLSAEAVIDSDPYISSKLGAMITFSSPSAEFECSFREFTSTHRENVELWPLIARVFVRSDAAVLQHGLTLVDLPGMLDSNTARASIYERYLQKCDHVFIVAPIKRAATDHIAQDLLGKAFKAQFKMDQKYTAEAITFIATGNDDISCKEIISQLDLSKDEEWTTLDTAGRDIAQQITAIEKDIDDMYAGHLGNKRHVKSRLRSFAVTSRQVAAELSEEEAKKLDLRVSDAQAKCDRLLQSKSEQERQKKLFCAIKRGEWSRAEIQRDFKNGLEDLCDEGDIEDIGDISVFTVSAHDYLKLIGKSPDDGSPSTFQSEEDTAIPDLIRYCQRLGLPRVQETREKWAAMLSKLAEDLESQVSDSVVQSKKDQASLRDFWCLRRPTGPDNDTAEMTMKDEICREVRRMSDKTREKVLEDLNKTLIPHMQRAAEEAGKNVAEHIYTLGQNIMFWQTIKALFRRNGVWKHHDWNSAAVELFQRRIAASWARILGVQRFEEGTIAIEELLRSSLTRVLDKTPDHLKPPVTQCIERAMRLVQLHIQSTIQERRASIQEHQQDVSRSMSRKITAQMMPLYASGLEMKGKGAKARAMDLMRKGLEACCDTLFTSIVQDTAHALRTSLMKSLDIYSAKLSEIPGTVEEQMSLLWSTGRQAAGTAAFTEQQAAPIRDMLTPVSLLITAYKDRELI